MYIDILTIYVYTHSYEKTLIRNPYLLDLFTYINDLKYLIYIRL